MGAVIVGENNSIRSTGLNGFPRGIDDYNLARQERPEKYFWMEHAERNAIYNAAEAGISTRNTRIYVTCHPCAECMRAIIQSGIKKVIIAPKHFWADSPAMAESFKRAQVMAAEAKIDILILEEYIPLERIKVMISGKDLTISGNSLINTEHK
jgi:dCMP deaminase